ncbi:NUDIX hydrolase [Dyella lipolytica]|nr:NUDIX hydrolase [Dyella lipolytica]
MSLYESLRGYAAHYPNDSHVVACMAFLMEAERPFDRDHATGHFTGSAWLVDPEGQHVLLTHHRKLNRWLQLGGHADGDSDLAAVALREAHEESGMTGLSVDPAIYDVDRHWIPARNEEPGHWHYDVRYVVRAHARDAFVVSDESLDLAWVSIRALADDDATDESLRRMARKWLERETSTD